MSIVTSKLLRIVRATGQDFPEAGTVEFALCGYGPFIPSSFTPLTQFALITEPVVVDPASGAFTVVLTGNDVINPAGTYYTYTVKDSNGDIVQCVAYQFLDGQDYDLAGGNVPQFDPNQPPPPIPPLVTNLLLTVPYSATPEFPGDVFTSWRIVLAGDATATFTNLVDGNLYTIIIIQDANGNHAFYWPANVYNATPVNPDPNGMTVQTFVAVTDALYPIGAGTYYP